MEKLIFALSEEIGETELFVGRKAELNKLLHWVELVKKTLSQSTAILARRKKGKTALVQRLFNHIYTMNDPQVIPFYFTIPERSISLLAFSELFYCSLLSQYFGFKLRRPDFIKTVLSLRELREYAQGDEIILRDLMRMEEIKQENNIDLSWEYARQTGHRISDLKEERIIQIIDEFQYLNKYIYIDSDHTKKIEIASAYRANPRRDSHWSLYISNLVLLKEEY